ncbi:MAG: hypothetical protein ACM30E_13450 [Nitrososphaerales archaeon]
MSLGDLFRQLSLLVGTPAVVLAGIAAVLIVVPRDWRIVLFGYAVVTVMLSLLLSQVVPAEWALQQAIAGGMVAIMLFLSARELGGPVQARLSRSAAWPRMASLTPFRALAVGLAAVTFAAVRESVDVPIISPLFRDAALWLGLIGLVGLALHEEPLHAGLSLLTFLGAAELVIFTLIQRQMLVGLLQGGQVLLGLAIAYLVVANGLALTRSPMVDEGPDEWEPTGGAAIAGAAVTGGDAVTRGDA